MPTLSLGHWYVPAEWEHHNRSWMSWPRGGDSWPEGPEAAAQAELARTIAAFEPVTMICNPDDAVDASLACGHGIQVLPLDIGEGWIRDIGPSFLVNDNGGVAGLHWHARKPNAGTASGLSILEHLGLPGCAAPPVLEGGAFSVDGAGTVLVTEQCLLGRTHNSGLSHQEIETHLKSCTGATTVIWLGSGCRSDAGGGHVDEVACFVAPGVVLALTTDDPLDGHFSILQDNLDRLTKARDARGRALEVVSVRQPARRPLGAGPDRLFMSYTSLCFANGVVILPGFGDAADQEARRTLRKLFPRREVVQLPALDIAAASGSLHDLTLHQPAPLPLSYDPVI